MDRETVDVYEAGAATYRSQRKASDPELAERFAASLPVGALRLDLGCGPGFYLPMLGRPAIASDAARAMCVEARDAAPDVAVVCHDSAALPFGDATIGGVWAWKILQHLPAAQLPGALAELHRVMPVGGRLAAALFAPHAVRASGAITGPDDSFPGRLFTRWTTEELTDLLIGAGFDVEALDAEQQHDDEVLLISTATRARTLPDIVGPGMRLLVCGLNPSLYAADAGVGFARPGNRFWPAALQAGIVTVDRDPRHALRHHGVGFTDLVKRATPAAAELTAIEYAAGLARLDRLCELLAPVAVACCGLAGWRAAVDAKATTGWQDRLVGGRPAYVLPNPSGLNAHVQVADVAAHLRAAYDGPTRRSGGSR